MEANEGMHLHISSQVHKRFDEEVQHAELKHVSTLMSMATTLDSDKNGEAIDQIEYRSMIGSLLYLTVTRPDIQFAVCLCACFQSFPRFSHQTTVQ
jgi:hypothetical protein